MVLSMFSVGTEYDVPVSGRRELNHSNELPSGHATEGLQASL
jgi:hypothetical protein